MGQTFIIGAGFLLLALGSYTFRAGLGDYLYAALRNWKQTAFIVICVAAGLIAGSSAAHVGAPGTLALPALEMPRQETGQAAVDSCRDFVTARLERGHGPPPGGALKIGRPTWESCAKVFGTNYWKHDISINGENGGLVLCRAYRQDSYRSGNVDAWCDTVFAPQRKT